MTYTVYPDAKINADALLEPIKRYTPSDLIFLDREADLRILELWTQIDEDTTIPSDIFFAKTVPLLSCDIVIDDGVLTGSRVIIFEDYAARAETEKAIGIIALDNGLGDVLAYSNIYAPMFENAIACDTMPVIIKDVDEKNPSIIKAIHTLMAKYLQTWYGIQIALLHPDIKDVFSHPHIEAAVSQEQQSGKKRRRKTKYIKRHIITADAIDKALLRSTHGKINRKCLAWYVVGHWRTYKDGKKVFIQPYWKGAMRSLKKNAPGDNRERIIV